jgi:sulfonate transport system permease protein
VIGEMLASRSGVGQWILFAGRAFRAGDLFAGIILLGALGFVSAGAIAWLEHRLLRWRRPN